MSGSFTICHVNVARNYRGGERQTELLIRELARRGYRQVLVCRRGQPLGQRFSDVDLDIRLVSGNPIGVARAAHGSDVLHIHEGRSVYAAYLRWLFLKTPYVITRRVNNPIREHRWAHRTYQNAVCVACVAPQVAEIVRAYDAAIKVAVVHSGSSGFVPNASEVAKIRKQWEGKFLVGHVGALDNGQKGQEYIIEAARQFEAIDPRVHFVLVGGGDDEQMLRELASGLSNLSFIGFVDNVGDYLAAFDLFILPSNREGIGSILFDAMEQRLAIVASSVGGVPDIVHDGENGKLIEPGNVDQLRDAIVSLRSDPQLREQMGLSGAEIASRYTASAMSEKYIEIYEAALGGRNFSVGTE